MRRPVLRSLTHGGGFRQGASAVDDHLRRVQQVQRRQTMPLHRRGCLLQHGLWRGTGVGVRPARVRTNAGAAMWGSKKRLPSFRTAV